MSKIKIILLVLMIIILIVLGVGLYLYNHNTDFYISLKYGKDSYVSKYYVNDNLDVIRDKIASFQNYVKKDQFSVEFAVYDDKNVSSRIDHISAHIAIISGNLNIKFYNSRVYEKNFILNDFDGKSIHLSIPNEKIEYACIDSASLYCLTESGKIYAYYILTGGKNVRISLSQFNSIIQILENNSYKLIDNYTFKELINIEEYNDFPFNAYALTTDDKIINLDLFNSVEINSVYNYNGLVKFAFNNNGSIKLTTYKNMQAEIGNTIVDSEGKEIIVYSIFTANHEAINGYTRGTLFVIDVNGNIYSENVNNGSLIKLDTLKKYSDKKVEYLSFIYNSLEDAKKNNLKNLIITYTDGTYIKFKDKPINVITTSLN